MSAVSFWFTTQGNSMLLESSPESDPSSRGRYNVYNRVYNFQILRLTVHLCYGNFANMRVNEPLLSRNQYQEMKNLMGKIPG